MKRPFWISVVVIAVGILAYCLKGPHVTKEFPFAFVPFEDFSIGNQDFSWGLGEEDFQIQVPDRGELDQVDFRHGTFTRKRIHLANWGIGSTYAIAHASDNLFVFENNAVGLFNGEGSRQIWYLDLTNLVPTLSGELFLNGQAYPLPDGSVVVFLKKEEHDTDSIELAQFYPEQGKQDVLLSLPEETDKGFLKRFDLPNGFITSRGPSRNPLWEPAQFYGWDGKPAPHPLAVGINLLHQHKMDLYPPALLSPSYGALFCSQTKDSWGLFTWDSMPNQPGKHLFLLSVTDTVQAVPVTCDRFDLGSESLEFLLVNPIYNIFLAGVRQSRHDDSIKLFLGRVRKDPSGKLYRAETFRIGTSPEVASPIFSRNGQVLLFASRMPNGTNLVFSHLPDLVAEVNRRYPDAKFNLDELK